MPQDDINQGLAGWGNFGQQFQEMGITDPTSTWNVQSALSQMFGREVPKGLVTGMDKNLQQGMQFGTYRPLLEQKRTSLLADLTKNLGGKQMGQAYGGFSGAAAAVGKEQEAKDVYGQGAGDVLKNIGQLQSGARRSVMDVVNQWKMAGQAIK